MQRYFANIVDNKVNLSKDDEHHVTRVMRNKVGDQIEVVDNSTLFLCEITSFTPLTIKVVKRIENNAISKNITLFFALAKGEKNDLVLQKACELGVKNIVLINTKRCISKLDNDDFNRKLVRYNKILKEASEQSKRLDIPKIHGIYNIKDIPTPLYENANNFIAYEKEKGDTTSFYEQLVALNKNDSVSIAIGPEGGFDKEEVEQFNSLGFKNVSLGNRILRTETAAIYALSVIGFILER